MSILQLPIKPPRDADRGPDDDDASRPLRMRSGRFGELEAHELIHLLDAIDDERAKARFRESIYISVIVWLAVAWFLFYGPHILFHQPYYKDPIAMMKEHDKQQLTYIAPTPPMPKAPPIDRKTMEALKQQALERKVTPPAPTPQPPQPAQPTPQEQARAVTPPVAQPALPMPSSPAPRSAPNAPSAPLPAAPAPNFAGSAIPTRPGLGTRGGSIQVPHAGGGELGSNSEILSDTQGVDFSAYMRRLHADVQRNWDPLIPEEVAPPILKRGITGIRFTILPDGQIGNMILESPTGDMALDRAAWSAIVSEGQFPPLPKAFHGPGLELRVRFLYNEPM